MKKAWPRAHKNLAAVMLLFLAVGIAVYAILLRPRVQQVHDMQAQLGDLRKKLRDSGWTLNADNLQALLNENTRKLKGTKQGDSGSGSGSGGLEEKARDIIDRATVTFKRHVEDNYTTAGTFIDQAGWLDYQSDFTDIEQWLRGHDVIISEKSFGISQDTTDAETYQLLLHIWTVRELVQLAIEHDLVLAKDRANPIPTPEGRAILASQLRVLPMQAYVLNEDDAAPYLLEFPVAMTLRGTLQDFIGFVSSLQTEEHFLPVTRLELRTENPAFRGSRAGSDGMIRVQNIEVRVVCCSYFRPQEGAPEVKIRKVEEVPRGA